MKYQELKKKIQEANPEIMKIKFGCKLKLHWISGWSEETVIEALGDDDTDDLDKMVTLIDDAGNVEEGKDLSQLNFEIIGRPIRLADVLLALEKLNGDSIGIDAEGFFVSRKWDEGIGLSSKWNEQGTHRMYRWNLKDDNLDNQSNECKEFLMSILL
jgi:hypothetical protein